MQQVDSISKRTWRQLRWVQAPNDTAALATSSNSVAEGCNPSRFKALQSANTLPTHLSGHLRSSLPAKDPKSFMSRDDVS